MMRWSYVAMLLLLAACTQPPRASASLLPPVVAAWQRKSLRGLPPPKVTIARSFEAFYEGAGKLTVDLYEAKVSGAAFEMTQHWRATPDTVFFDKGVYFVVVKWEQADREALKAFVRALERNLEQ